MKKETRAAREARMNRNKAKRATRGPVNGHDLRETMIRQRVAQARAAKATKYAEAYVKVLMDASNEYYDGEVRYAVLRAKNAQVGAQCKREVEEALAPFLAIPKAEQTEEHLDSSAGIIQRLHQRFVDEGKLVPQNLRVWEVPQARVYKDGRVEAVNRVRDMDIRDMGARYLAAQENIDEKKE